MSGTVEHFDSISMPLEDKMQADLVSYSGRYKKDRIGALAVGLNYGTGSKCWQQYSPLSLIQTVACSVSLISSTGRAGQGMGSPSQHVLRALYAQSTPFAASGAGLPASLRAVSGVHLQGWVGVAVSLC